MSIDEMAVQLIAAFLGSLGFAILLRIGNKQIIWSGIGGLVTWFIYLLVFEFTGDYFTGNIVASVFVALYAEIMARVHRAPTTIFLTAAAVPLIPGGKLYYTMYGIVSHDSELFAKSAKEAIMIALAIALGFVIVTIINRYTIAKIPKKCGKGVVHKVDR